MREFFLDWAMREVARGNPRSYVRVIDGGIAIMGHVPNDHDGTTVTLHARPREQTCRLLGLHNGAAAGITSSARQADVTTGGLGMSNLDRRTR